MKRIVLFFAMSVIVAHTFAQRVNNVSFVQEGQKVLISYELSEWSDIVVEVSTDGGYTYGMIDMQHVYGDVGEDVPPGAIREITWDVLQDCEGLQGDLICFRVTAINHEGLVGEDDNRYDVTSGKELITIVPEEEKEEEEELIFVLLQEEAEYPGGMDSLFAYLKRNINYPDLARDNGITGTVYVKFVIGKDGSVIKTMILKDIGGGCGEEACRVLENMPRWKPGKMLRHPVNIEFSIPIKFSLL